MGNGKKLNIYFIQISKLQYIGYSKIFYIYIYIYIYIYLCMCMYVCMYVCVMVYPFNYLFIYPFHEIGNGRPCPYGQKGTSFDTCSGMLGL